MITRSRPRYSGRKRAAAEAATEQHAGKPCRRSGGIRFALALDQGSRQARMFDLSFADDALAPRARPST